MFPFLAEREGVETQFGLSITDPARGQTVTDRLQGRHQLIQVAT